ncbi:hypothetical protein [Salibacterium sp. K-3]
MKKAVTIIIDIVLIAALWFVMELAGVDVSIVVPALIQWATKYILPWIVLYWLIRLIKSLEKR